MILVYALAAVGAWLLLGDKLLALAPSIRSRLAPAAATKDAELVRTLGTLIDVKRRHPEVADQVDNICHCILCHKPVTPPQPEEAGL